MSHDSKTTLEFDCPFEARAAASGQMLAFAISNVVDRLKQDIESHKNVETFDYTKGLKHALALILAQCIEYRALASIGQCADDSDSFASFYSVCKDEFAQVMADMLPNPPMPTKKMKVVK